MSSEPANPPPAWKSYAVAVLAVGLAVGVRAVLYFFIGSYVPYITFFPVIIFSTLYGGYRAGVLAAGLSATAAAMWINPVGSIRIEVTEDQIGLVLFLCVSGVIIWLCEKVRRESARAALGSRKSATILESISDAFFAVDGDWRFTYVNAQAEEFLGKTRDELLGRNLWERFPAARGSVFEDFYRRAMDGKAPVSFEASSTLRPDRWLEVNAYPAADGLSVYSRDITARKRLEAEREELLRREKQAREEAEDANRLKDEFLANVSHELRTPLNAILGWSNLSKNHDFSAERTRQALEVIERNAKAQNKIIEDILDVSRIITGKLNLQLSRVDLAGVLESSLEAVRPAAEARQIRITTSLEVPPEGDSAAFVYADADRLRQALWNLLSNAVKFTPEGEGRIEVSLRRGGDGNHFEVAVSDNGEGIDPEFLPFVFERFRQADGGTTRKYGGLGLGLAIVRHIAELHGGRVTAHSEGKGKGATFTLSLPSESPSQKTGDLEAEARESPPPPAAAAAAAVSAAAPETSARTDDLQTPPPARANGLAAPPSALSPGKKTLLADCRILLVDDDPDARELVCFILSGSGAQLSVAKSAGEALAKFDENFPDVLISDIGMPGVDGFDLLRRVKTLYPPDRTEHLVAIALTAYSRPEDVRRALSEGYQHHLAKPFEPSRLLETVAESVGRTGRCGA